MSGVAHTPGPWAVDADPIEDQDYETLIVLPDPNGSCGTWIARAEHNWNEAEAGQRRISWAEAQANARLMAAAPDLLEALEALELQALQSPDLRRTEWGEEALALTRAAIARARGQ